MKHHKYKWNLQPAHEAGFEISDHQMTAGPVLEASGAREIADTLSDAPKLSKFAEVRLEGSKPGKEVYIKTPALISNPHAVVGYQPSGSVAALPVLDAFTGNANISGPPGGGKSTLLALIIYQLIRLGFPVIILALKALDAILLASMKAAVASRTRIDASGNLCSGQFSLVTLDPDLPSERIAGLLQAERNLPASVRAARLLPGLGLMGGPQDAQRRYFISCSQVLLQSISDWGETPRDLHEKIEKLKLSRDIAYGTSGLRNEIAQQAAIDVANASRRDRGSISITDAIANNGALYIDACSQVVGESATAFAGLVVNNIISAKRMVDPDNQKPLFLVIDESQQMFRPALKLAAEQVRGFNIKLILAFQSPSQFGDDWEAINMARTRIVTGAVPGGFVDQVLLPRSFGTKKVFAISFGLSKSLTNSSSVTVSPQGTSFSTGVAETNGINFGFTEQEKNVFGANETLDLNADPKAFVLHVSPGCDLAHFGPRPIICERGSSHMTRDEVAHFVREALEDTRKKLLSGSAERLTLAEMPSAAAAKRQSMLGVLNSAAARFRQPNS